MEADDFGLNGSGGNSHVVVYFVGCDGGTAASQLQPGQSWFSQILQAHCCPCCVGGFISRERTSEYKRLLKRFNFWISITQIILLFIAVSVGGGFATLSENPLFGPTTRGLLKCGAKYSWAIVHGKQVYRLITPTFLHAGVIHLIVNIFAQLRLGLYSETKWGFFLYSMIYISSGVGGTLLSAILSPDQISVGASGAMAGIMSAVLCFVYLMPDPRDPLRQFSLLLLFLITVVLLFVGISPGVDFSAHLGGALVGFLIALSIWGSNISVFANWPKAKKIIPLFFGSLAIIYFIVGFAILFTSVDIEPLLSDDI